MLGSTPHHPAPRDEAPCAPPGLPRVRAGAHLLAIEAIEADFAQALGAGPADGGVWERTAMNQVASKAFARCLLEKREGPERRTSLDLLSALLGAGASAPRDALALAARAGQTELARALALAGADLDGDPQNHDPFLGSPLMLAATCPGSLPLCSFLLDLGADPNQRDVEGFTAGHYALACCETELFEMLLDRGLEPATLDDQGLGFFDFLDKAIFSFIGRSPSSPDPERVRAAVGSARARIEAAELGGASHSGLAAEAHRRL